MTQHRAVFKGLAATILAALSLAAIFLLSACQDVAPAPTPTGVPQSPTPTASVQPPSNFGFRFEWSSCGAYTLDTFDHSLTAKSITVPPMTTTVDLVLSQQELGRISQKMADINLFSYPAVFSIHLPPDAIRVYGIAALYYFDVRSGNERKTVRWHDEFSEPADMPWKDADAEPTRTQAVRLRELITMIQQIVEGHPEFSTLAPPGGCA